MNDGVDTIKDFVVMVKFMDMVRNMSLRKILEGYFAVGNMVIVLCQELSLAKLKMN